MLLAIVAVPLTTKLEVPLALVIAGLVPLMLNEPIVSAFCISTVALLMVSKLLVLPKVPLPVTRKVPAFTVVAPVYKLVPDKVSVPLPVFVNAPEVESDAPVIVKVCPDVATSIVPVVDEVIVKFRLVLTLLLSLIHI